MNLNSRTCQRTLAFVNRIRVEQGRRPLRRLPKGTYGFYECPVAVATGMRVSWFDADHGPSYLDLHKAPRYVGEFVLAFDTGRIPELIV